MFQARSDYRTFAALLGDLIIHFTCPTSQVKRDMNQANGLHSILLQEI
jgi:hypothetical protein